METCSLEVICQIDFCGFSEIGFEKNILFGIIVHWFDSRIHSHDISNAISIYTANKREHSIFIRYDNIFVEVEN